MLYADYNGSAPLLKPVREYLHKRIDADLFGNPNAIHTMGQKLSTGIEKCRALIADIVGCHPDQLYFNSGSSEGVSQIIRSVLEFAPKNKNWVLTSRLEHPVIAKALSFYQERFGFKIEYVEIEEGKIVFDNFKKLINQYKDQIALVTIMAANNETGVIQPYKEMAKICQENNIEFFSDTTQLIGKAEFNFEKSGIDYAVCSGHKIGALTGTGFIIAKEPTKLQPHVFGSSQEKGLRGGTQNYLGIETLAVAFDDFAKNKSKLESLKKARLKFEADLKATFPEVKVVGDKSDRLAGTTLVGYPGIHGQAIQIELESQDIFVTTSAACTDNQPETSKVLKAMGIDDQLGRGVIRISLSYSHGEEDYFQLARALKEAYTKLGKIQSY